MSKDTGELSYISSLIFAPNVRFSQSLSHILARILARLLLLVLVKLRPVNLVLFIITPASNFDFPPSKMQY